MDCHSLMDLVIKEYENQTEFSKIFDSACGSKDKLKVVTLLVEKFNYDFDTCKIVCDCFIDGTPLPSTLSPQQIAHNNAVAREWQNKLKCITCGSTNVKPISDTERAMSVVGLGIFSKKINKTFKCLNCKCTW